ncbi:hypothetical protein [Sphingobacterium tabacisoli]|uniref:DUF4369 domain-containing protein n=1 Tax=Sphingobacterium tabacisoli TaxID=2044855 RepID=A0ABW5L2Y0_9SPHI|nr:hypothetical protein [Sphingobacterium tabacisoli]
MRIPLVLFVVIFFQACGFKREDGKKNQEVNIQLTGLPVDSCSFRINHIITGKEVFNKENVDLSKPIRIPGLEDDMYIAVFSWPRTLISHQVFRSRGFDKEDDYDLFQLTKPLYIDHKNGSTYHIEVVNEVSIEELERKGASTLQFKNIACKECDLADRYWDTFSEFFDRKERLIDSAKQVYYSYIDANDLQKGNKAFLDLEEIKNHFAKDELLDTRIQELVAANPESNVSTFFLFYQLYNHREFQKLENTFKLLKGKGQDSKYYKMVKKQYDEL